MMVEKALEVRQRPPLQLTLWFYAHLQLPLNYFLIASMVSGYL